MILNTDKPEVVHSGEPIRRINMNDMDAESIAVMIENSRDGFYSNKELAPLREYSTNARDSHIVSGIPTRPIEITLPTELEPELKIRDFGKGLSIDELTEVYFKYWKSTKRGSNLQNGCLGIGAKSAFAYAPFYTVTTWCDGIKTVANGQKNGTADIIFHQKVEDGEEQGVEVAIPIQAKDIQKFILEALEFFKFWDVRPIFHGIDEEKLKGAFAAMDTKPFLSGDGWEVRPAGFGKGETKAVMSFVPYNIDWNQVRNSIAPELNHKISGVFDFLEENLTTLYFRNGTLSFIPNRESLQYNDVTIKALSEKLTTIYDSLLNLITSKISDAANLWEAKIRYNMLFRKELDGFDRTFAYGGNLQTLENLLNGRITWNGIPITNGYFEGMDNWCATDGKVGSSHDDTFTPILTTYVKNDDKTGVVAVRSSRRRRRYSSTDSKIICSPKSIIVIQDTDKPYLAKGYAGWLFYKSGLDVSQVYVLDLAKTEVKSEFYKEFQFDTVPFMPVAPNEPTIKEYLKSIRAKRSTDGSTKGTKRPLNCPYISIENRRSTTSDNYVSNPWWKVEDTNARGIEGGYFVVYNKKSFTYKGREVAHDDMNMFWQYIYELALMAGVDLSKVYGIHPKVADSEWFKDSVENGDWIDLADFVSDNVDLLPKDIIKKMASYELAADNRIGTNAANELFPMLVDPNNVAGKYFNEVAGFIKHWNLRSIAHYLRLDGFGSEEAETKRFTDVHSEIRKKYPLMFRTSHWSALSTCDRGSIYSLGFPIVRELADYINLMDCYA